MIKNLIAQKLQEARMEEVWTRQLPNSGPLNLTDLYMVDRISSGHGAIVGKAMRGALLSAVMQQKLLGQFTPSQFAPCGAYPGWAC